MLILPWTKVLRVRPHAEAVVATWRTASGWDLLSPEQDLCAAVASASDLEGPEILSLGLTESGSNKVIGIAKWEVKAPDSRDSKQLSIQVGGCGVFVILYSDKTNAGHHTMRDLLEMAAIQASFRIRRPLILPAIPASSLSDSQETHDLAVTPVPAPELGPAPLVSAPPVVMATIHFVPAPAPATIPTPAAMAVATAVPAPTRVTAPVRGQPLTPHGQIITSAPTSTAHQQSRLRRLDQALNRAGLLPGSMGATLPQRLRLVQEIVARRRLIITRIMTHLGQSAYSEVGGLVIAIVEQTLAAICERQGAFRNNPWDISQVSRWLDEGLRLVPSPQRAMMANVA